MNNYIFYIGALCILISGCNRTGASENRLQLKVITTLALSEPSKFEKSEYYTLLMPLEPDQSENCANGFIIDMALTYLPSNQKVDIKPTLDKSQEKTLAAATNAIKHQFKNYAFPEIFFQQDTNISLEKRLKPLLAGADSVLVYITRSNQQQYSWKYPTFTKIKDLQTKISQIACKHNQLSFIVLIDPPVIVEEKLPKAITPVAEKSATPKPTEPAVTRTTSSGTTKAPSNNTSITVTPAPVTIITPAPVITPVPKNPTPNSPPKKDGNFTQPSSGGKVPVEIVKQ